MYLPARWGYIKSAWLLLGRTAASTAPSTPPNGSPSGAPERNATTLRKRDEQCQPPVSPWPPACGQRRSTRSSERRTSSSRARRSNCPCPAAARPQCSRTARTDAADHHRQRRRAPDESSLRRSPGDGRDRHGSQVAGNRLWCRPGARRYAGGRTGEVPVHLRDAYYPGAKVLGHGQGYLYPYGSEHGVVTQQDLPGRALGT
ncbi:hypothetical protein AB0465_14230 [Streptomyces griseoviridis]|uniref:AAA family ATPase n=1 Tax=Streptomyces griseoviridis TaxID=45398 RepID=UPI00344DE2F9